MESERDNSWIDVLLKTRSAINGPPPPVDGKISEQSEDQPTESTACSTTRITDRSIRTPNHPIKMVGFGSFCMVYKTIVNGRDLAIKLPRDSAWKRDKNMAIFRASNEAKILQKLDHENIIEFVDYIEDRKPLIVTEYITGYTLRSALKKPDVSSCLSPKIRVKILMDLLKALTYLHTFEPKIVHKDLKSENILVDLNCRVVLCDFGDAERINKTISRYTATTWCYAPPELVENYMREKMVNPLDEKVDIWALGCIVIELCGFPTPFENLMRRVRRSVQPSTLHDFYRSTSSSNYVPKELPPKLQKVIKHMLNKNSNNRPSAQILLEWTYEHRKVLNDEFQQLDKLHGLKV